MICLARCSMDLTSAKTETYEDLKKKIQLKSW